MDSFDALADARPGCAKLRYIALASFHDKRQFPHSTVMAGPPSTGSPRPSAPPPPHHRLHSCRRGAASRPRLRPNRHPAKKSRPGAGRTATHGILSTARSGWSNGFRLHQEGDPGSVANGLATLCHHLRHRRPGGDHHGIGLETIAACCLRWSMMVSVSASCRGRLPSRNKSASIYQRWLVRTAAWTGVLAASVGLACNEIPAAA